MAKIPFTLEAWLKDKSQRVETKSGFPAIILHCDGYGESPILVTVDLGDGRGVQTRLYFADGKLYKEESDADLFIVTPEPELTEFEKVLNDLIWSIGMGEVVYNNDAIKETAAKLLNLARKQLVEEQYTSDPRKTDLYKLGKAEALKDLPRWRHSLPELGRRYVILFNNGGIVESTDFRENGRFYYEDGESYPDVAYNAVNWMYLEDLLKLPKED